MVHQLNTQNFKQFTSQSDKLVVVDFWAEWCGPCRMLGPIFEELSTELNDKLIFAKVNVDESPELAEQFGISSIPVVHITKNGQSIAEQIGFVPKEQWLTFFKNYS
jgi:thioredoxin 1